MLANLSKLDADAVKDNKRVAWCSIRKQTLKEVQIDRYAIRMKKKQNLNLDHAQYLTCTCPQLSISSTMGKGYVVDVRVINIIDGTVHVLATAFERDPVLRTVITSKPKKKKHMADSFFKYCSHLRKKSA